MDKMVLRIFQTEVFKQCEFAITSATYMNNVIHNADNKNNLWYFTQNFLIASANVSKLLWGSKKKISQSRLPLRESLNIKENSLIKSRELRNDFEHFDERVESWSLESQRKNFMDSCIGPINMFNGIDPEDIFRHFDTHKMEITFKGKTYELQPILDELIEVHSVAKCEAQKAYN